MATVLIVDDSSMARRNLRNILTSAGHTIVAEATNGVQAFVEYENHKPDLVTMDVTMPILSGIDGVKKIIKSYPDAKIIMVSALNQKLMILDALQSGAKHYIVKPFSYEKVNEVVNEVIQYSCQPMKSDKSSLKILEQKIKPPSIPVYQSNANKDEVIRPFFIENTAGVSVINISRSMCEKNIAALKFGVQRISSNKPFKVIFNFGDVDNISDDTFNKIVDVFNSILTLEGSCIMVSKNQNFVMNVSGKNSSIPIKLYSGSLDISSLNL